MGKIMVSTKDNPYNPFTQFDEWNAYDMEKRYYTLSYLARLVFMSDNLTEDEAEYEIDSAVHEIIRMNINGMYILVREGEPIKYNNAG